MSSDQRSTKDKIKDAIIQEAMANGPHIMTEVLFNKIFNHHTISDPISTFNSDDFPLLKAKKVHFNSDHNKLTGYFYEIGECDKSKIVIFVHGFGNGHHRYLDLIHYLVKCGLYVFSYDATSFDESEGDGIRGFPQGIIDLTNAINYVKSLGYKESDISLVGHSWGAYSSGAVVKDFPNISKVVMISGFNKSLDLIRYNGTQWGGEKFASSFNYVEEYEQKYYPKYSLYSVVDAFNNSKTEYLFIHSEDDKTVPISAGLDFFKKEIGKNDRTMYIRLTDMGHGTSYDSIKGKAYYDDLKKRYQEYLKDKKDTTREVREHLFNLIVDKEKWTDMLSYSLMDSIINFIRN